MNEKYLKKQLKTFQLLKPSSNVKEKITLLTKDLPSQRYSFFPLVTFQMGVALGVMVLFLVVGSGLIATINTSRPGSVLYPAKKVINTIPMEILHTHIIKITPVPRLSITPSLTPTVTQGENSQDNKKGQSNKEDNNYSHSHHEVEGAATHNIPNFFHHSSKHDN